MLYYHSFIEQVSLLYMKKQEILEIFNKQFKIENYSEQVIRNYLFALKLFLEYIKNLQTTQVTDSEIQNYLFFCKTKKMYSYSSMKLIIAAIIYLYKKFFF